MTKRDKMSPGNIRQRGHLVDKKIRHQITHMLYFHELFDGYANRHRNGQTERSLIENRADEPTGKGTD